MHCFLQVPKPSTRVGNPPREIRNFADTPHKELSVSFAGGAQMKHLIAGAGTREISEILELSPKPSYASADLPVSAR
jgi:hypothetical protein